MSNPNNATTVNNTVNAGNAAIVAIAAITNNTANAGNAAAKARRIAAIKKAFMKTRADELKASPGYKDSTRTVMYSTNPSATRSLHPRADLDLEVGPLRSGKVFRAKVCRSLLRVASPVFDALLDPTKTWSEGSSSKLQLPEDNPEAMRCLVFGLHYRLDELPRILTVTEVFQLSMLCDKYDCLEILRTFICDSRFTIKTDALLSPEHPEALGRWLATCHMFGWKREFAKCASLWILKLKWQAIAFNAQPGPPSMHRVLGGLLKIREETQRAIAWEHTEADIRHAACIAKSGSEKEAHLCSTIITGSWHRSLDHAPYFPLASIDYDTEDYAAVDRKDIDRSVEEWQTLPSIHGESKSLTDVVNSTGGDESIAKRHRDCGFGSELKRKIDLSVGIIPLKIRDRFKDVEEHPTPNIIPYYEELSKLQFAD
ncbi:MAG: hypothetical protein M1828_005444 [Chrysothrix sp. TS-e1954]|nr:MAG: hypothetical protein M1828_005444 [Chrysothrix sp. TS-e1954]